MRVYTSIQGDTLDKIVHDFYGDEQQYLEEILKKNRKIANLGDLLPAGTRIKLPYIALESNSTKESISLWD